MPVWPKGVPAPLFIRPANKVRFGGKEYLVRRDVHGAIYKIIGRVQRKLHTMRDAVQTVINKKPVAQWGSQYLMYIRVDAEDQPLILEALWEADEKRGIPRPDLSKGVQLGEDYF
jgi:hypothetical protein